MGCLYKIDFPNGKSYIGFTTRSFEERIKGHVKAAKSGGKLLIHNAIRKFKFQFDAKIIVIANGQDYLAEIEKRAISIYETLNPKGYNLTTGGEKSYTFSDSVKKKISDSMKGSRRRLGTRHTEESKELMRKAKIGRRLSDKTKMAMSESRKRFYSCEENLSALRLERKARNNSHQMSAMSAVGWAKRKGIPFSFWRINSENYRHTVGHRATKEGESSMSVKLKAAQVALKSAQKTQAVAAKDLAKAEKAKAKADAAVEKAQANVDKHSA